VARLGISLTDSTRIENVSIMYEDSDIYVLQENDSRYYVKKEAFLGISESK